MSFDRIGGISHLALEQARLRDRLDVLGQQVSTGRQGNSFTALGQDVRRSLDLRVAIRRDDAYLAGAERALARAASAQTALGRLQDIAGSVAAEALRARTMPASAIEALAQAAGAAMSEAAALFNTQHAGEYLFAGSDLEGRPVPDGEAILGGALATAIAADVALLDETNAATILADSATHANDPATTPFSAFLEGAGLTETRRSLQLADGERVSLGILANRDSGGAVAEAWGREMLRGLALLAALTPDQVASPEGLDALLTGAHGILEAAARGAAAEQGTLGAAESRIEAAAERHRDTLVALRGQLASIEEVDLAAASAAMTELRTRLSASYESLALLARLSLSDFLR
jgi:flagellin-like hook-associated protein FlgL